MLYIRPAFRQRFRLPRVNVHADDVKALLDETEKERQTDVPQSDDADDSLFIVYF
jgi:spermidine synthase